MIYRIALSFAVTATYFCLAAPSATANDCGGCGYGGFNGVHRFQHSDRQIPYFAEHPPVYYSFPVPRTYGHSPYAYPGTFRTPEIEMAPAPLMIENPHVTPEQVEPEAKINAEKDSTASKKLPRPLIVVNPYYKASPRVVSARVTR